MHEERSVTARADQNLRYRGDSGQSPILTTIIPFVFTQFIRLFPAQDHDNSDQTTRMPVATRSTTRKMRSLTVYAKPPPEAAGQPEGKSKPSSRTISKPTSIGKRTKRVKKAIPRAAIKRLCKVANVEVAVAAPEPGEVERAERMVSMMYLLSLTVPHTSERFLASGVGRDRQKTSAPEDPDCR